jgi:hypothetical protein
MENDYDYYIYVYRNRIVKITKTRKYYDVVKYPNVVSYKSSVVPKYNNVTELLYNYSYSLEKEGVYEISNDDHESLENIDSLKRMNNIITVLEKFESVCSYIKSSVLSRSADEDIYNRILMQQIDNYEKNGIVGNLLEAEFKCSIYENYDSLIEAIKLKYDDASEMFAFIKYKTFDIKKLLKENDFFGANNILKEMYQKMRV